MEEREFTSYFIDDEIKCAQKNYQSLEEKKRISLYEKIYEFGSYIIHEFQKKSEFRNKLEHSQIIQLNYFARMVEGFRTINLLTVLGYSEQAATLCASLWEQMHMIMWIDRAPKTSEDIINLSDEIKLHIPEDLYYGSKREKDKPREKIRWKKICEENLKFLPHKEWKREYDFYSELCRAKHTHPHLVGFLKEHKNGEISIPFGPHLNSERGWDPLSAVRLMLPACFIFGELLLDNSPYKETPKELQKSYDEILEIPLKIYFRIIKDELP